MREKGKAVFYTTFLFVFIYFFAFKSMSFHILVQFNLSLLNEDYTVADVWMEFLTRVCELCKPLYDFITWMD